MKGCMHWMSEYILERLPGPIRELRPLRQQHAAEDEREELRVLDVLTPEERMLQVPSKFIAICAPTGSGKTYFFRTLMSRESNSRWLVVTQRRSLAKYYQGQFADLGFVHYEDIVVSRTSPFHTPRLIICLPSLSLLSCESLGDSSWNLFMDELGQARQMAASPELLSADRMRAVDDNLTLLVNAAPKVLMAQYRLTIPDVEYLTVRERSMTAQLALATGNLHTIR